MADVASLAVHRLQRVRSNALVKGDPNVLLGVMELGAMMAQLGEQARYKTAIMVLCARDGLGMAVLGTK